MSYRCDPCKAVVGDREPLRRHVVLGPPPLHPIREEVPVCPKCQAELIEMRRRGVPSADAIAALRRRHQAVKSVKTESGVTVTTTVGGMKVLDRFPERR